MTEGEKAVVAKMVKAGLGKGWAISVYDGEETVVRKSTDFNIIWPALFSTETDSLIFWAGDGKERVGSIWLIYGNAPDGSEVVADWSSNPATEGLLKEIGYID